MKKYSIEYEVLVYNMPECKDFEFLDHKFFANQVTPELEKVLIPNDDLLKANYLFRLCCNTYEDGHSSYMTMKNNNPIVIECEDLSDEELNLKVNDIVEKKINAVEEHIILITNLHIFFPCTKIYVYNEDGSIKLVCGLCNIRPMPFYKWTWIAEKINVARRLFLNIDKPCFDKFRLHKNHSRYNRAFKYYIKSFEELDHATAFCLLCSSVDAITGKSGSNETKKRLAKYMSVLLCEPLKMKEIQDELEHFYKLRSDFMHGKGSKITPKDELKLREYVRRFLIAYFLFWTEMAVKSEQQMLQKLDEIYTDNSLYLKYAVAAYSFMTLSEEHEKQENGITNLSLPQKYAMALAKLMETQVGSLINSEPNGKLSINKESDTE